MQFGMIRCVYWDTVYIKLMANSIRKHFYTLVDVHGSQVALPTMHLPDRPGHQLPSITGDCQGKDVKEIAAMFFAEMFGVTHLRSHVCIHTLG